MNFRLRTEETEKNLLSQYAQLSHNTKGRVVSEEECDIRTCFQRDRDRIIHSKAFRRLMHKTQVYLSPEGDHYRTRLTHTIEVSQIGRTMARALRLNEDLAEAICLGHDLGHTPFGHEGEAVLNKVCKHGFKHYEQSLRVVDVLENNGKGLNLTFEVRDGIVNHTGDSTASTLEGKLIKFADRIAYINHDIDDSIRAKVLIMEDLPKECIKVLGDSHSKRISTLVRGIIEESYDKPEIIMKKEILGAMNELREFMFKNVYNGILESKRENKKAYYIISSLFEFFKENPSLMPKELAEKINEFDVDRIVCDYIAGMTDTYAIETFKEHFVPKAWK